MRIMVRLDEKIAWDALLRCAGKSETFKIHEVEAQVELAPKDNHIGDSPDFILWLVVSMKIFAQNIRVKIPLPIEVEEGGIGNAMEDFDKFIQREKFHVELPMIVVASKGFVTSERQAKLPADFKIKQVPARLLQSQS
jgi:hypothetical protein